MAGAVNAALINGHGGTFQVSLSRSNVFGFGYTPGSIQSQPVTCTPINGVPPYTYEWIQVGATSIFPTNATLATSKFTVYMSGPASEMDEYFCRVTDAAAATADSSNVSINLEGL